MYNYNVMMQINKHKRDKDFKPGDLVRIVVKGLKISEDGFSMGGDVQDEKSIKIYKNINLRRYPSCNDFWGVSTQVSEEDQAIIIRHVGRPDNISRDPVWFKYDVYEILINGNVFQIFAQNIRKY